MRVFVVSSQCYLYTILNKEKKVNPQDGTYRMSEKWNGQGNRYTVIGGAEKREPQTGMKISN